MSSIPENVIETRDEIVRNIFNCNAKVNEKSKEDKLTYNKKMNFMAV